MSWNDSDIPIAYLISFRACGTWLHGDARGLIGRHNNVLGSPTYGQLDHWNEISHARLKQDPGYLNAQRRTAIQRAIVETREKRVWKLWASNIRTNHVHAVSSIGLKKIFIAPNAFKANATRRMRESGCWVSDRSPWADKGTERWLWTEKHLYDAVDHVMNGQGDDLPQFV